MTNQEYWNAMARHGIQAPDEVPCWCSARDDDREPCPAPIPCRSETYTVPNPIKAALPVLAVECPHLVRLAHTAPTLSGIEHERCHDCGAHPSETVFVPRTINVSGLSDEAAEQVWLGWLRAVASVIEHEIRPGIKMLDDSWEVTCFRHEPLSIHRGIAKTETAAAALALAKTLGTEVE